MFPNYQALQLQIVDAGRMTFDQKIAAGISADFLGIIQHLPTNQILMIIGGDDWEDINERLTKEAEDQARAYGYRDLPMIRIKPLISERIS